MLSNLYTFKELLGKGQFGEIWKAEHKYTKETYAIKQNITSQNLLLHECKVMQFLQTHKNIPKLKWYGAINKHPSLIIEFMYLSLNELERDARIRCENVETYFNQMISVVEYIHSKGIIHRDIKPDNFMIRNNRKEICLIDFGLSRTYKNNAGVHHKYETDVGLIGSKNYCSINMHNGVRPSRRDDIESLLYVFIYYLEGQLPWALINIINETDMKLLLKLNLREIDFQGPTTLNYINAIKTCHNSNRFIKYHDKPDYDNLHSIYKFSTK